MPGHAAQRNDDLVLFELQALRLGLYGLEGIDPKVIRRLAHSRWWLETRLMLRVHGATEAEIAHLMGLHRSGCPCWECVMSLHNQVKAHQRHLRQKKSLR